MKKRIMSAIGMAILIIPLVIIGGIYFEIAMGFISILALKEIIDLKEHHKSFPKGIWLISFICLLFLVFQSICEFGFSYKNIALTLLCLFLPCIFYKKKYDTKDALYLSGSIFFLGFAFNGLILIRNYDLNHFLYLGLIPILTDSFAMAFGILIGKHKCIPDISPGKTWEGCIGGTFLGTILSVFVYMYLIRELPLLKVVLFTLILSIVGQLGDLFFSKIKRENKIKDFSSLIPGHGGILDRLDSLLFVVLAYMILFGAI